MGRDSRTAMVRLGADGKPLARDLLNAEKQWQTYSARVKGHITSSLRKSFNGLGGITGLAGIAGFGAMAREVKVFNDRLVRLGISAGRSRSEMLQFNTALQATAAATGAQQDDLLAGAEKYQELTGRFGEFEAALDSFARVQVATGASMESLATTAAALSDNLHVDPGQMLQVFDILASQGKMGAVELRNLADELAGLTGQFALFGTVGVQGTTELGAWLQILRKGAPSAAEAATQMAALMSGIRQNHRELSQFGVNVWANKAKGELKDLTLIADQILAKVPISELGRITDRKEFQNALITFRAHRDEFGKFMTTADKAGTIMADFGTQSQSAGGKLAIAEARLKQVFNEALIKNLDAIVTAFEALVRALSWMASHPEALAGLAVLWKGGGFLGTIAGLYGGAGGVGAAAGASGGGSAIGARVSGVLGKVGGAMQGAAVGYALAQTGEKLGDSFDDLSTAGMTAAGALVGLGGPIAALGVAIMGIKVATDWAIRDLDERQQKAAASDLGETAIKNAWDAFGALNSRTARTFVGSDGQIKTTADEFDPQLYLGLREKMGLGFTKQQRDSARFLLRRGKNMGFIDELGIMDTGKLDEYLAQDKSMQPYQRVQMRSAFLLSQAMLGADPETKADFDAYGINGMKPRGPVVFGTGGLIPKAPEAPSWQEQMAAGEAEADKRTMEWNRRPEPLEIRVRLIPTEGMTAVIENDRARRRRR